MDQAVKLVFASLVHLVKSRTCFSFLGMDYWFTNWSRRQLTFLHKSSGVGGKWVAGEFLHQKIFCAIEFARIIKKINKRDQDIARSLQSRRVRYLVQCFTDSFKFFS